MLSRLAWCCASIVCLVLSARAVPGATWGELAEKAKASQELARKADASLLVPSTLPEEFALRLRLFPDRRRSVLSQHERGAAGQAADE